MIFGIKTKKDKKIEELEKKVSDLEFLRCARIPTLRIHYDVVEVKAKSILEGYLPEEAIKKEIASKLVDYIEPFITYDIQDVTEVEDLKECNRHWPEGRPRILVGTLRVARGQQYGN